MFGSFKSTSFALLVVLTSACLFGACAPSPPPTAGPITLTDGLGREVSIPVPVQRIISIAPSNTEILFAIGAGSKLVGRDEISDYPPEAVEITSIGSTYGELNTEAIVTLEPDLVLAAMINSPEHVQAIEDLDITVFVLPNPLDFDDLYEILETAGRITGQETAAETLAESLKNRVNAVVEKTSGVDPCKVYYEVDGMDPAAPWTAGAGTFQDVLIQLAGGENVAADIEFYGQINLEALVTRDPEVMIFSEGPWVPTTPESVVERAGWADMTAVANGAVYGIDANWLDRPGPRLVDALETMAKLVHPERFD
jgi:iron complex transport system substrate-binding protein